MWSEWDASEAEADTKQNNNARCKRMSKEVDHYENTCYNHLEIRVN